jgi:hypothetical protein
VNRFTDGTEIRHFVMAITSTRLMTKGWLIIFACLLIGAGPVVHAILIDGEPGEAREIVKQPFMQPFGLRSLSSRGCIFYLRRNGEIFA